MNQQSGIRLVEDEPYCCAFLKLPYSNKLVASWNKLHGNIAVTNVDTPRICTKKIRSSSATMIQLDLLDSKRSMPLTIDGHRDDTIKMSKVVSRDIPGSCWHVILGVSVCVLHPEAL